METTRRFFRFNRSQIGFVKFILEAYDNVAVVSTLDPHKAVVQVTIAPGCESLVEGIMKSFTAEFEVALLDRAEGVNNVS